MADISHALIFAAGFGKRLQPLTSALPKPLVSVAGKPMLAHIFDRIQAAGLRKVVINGHYLAQKLENWLSENTPADMDVCYVYEPEILETGGGALNMLQSMAKRWPESDGQPVFVINGDSLWLDVAVAGNPFSALNTFWNQHDFDLLLLLAPTPADEAGDGFVDESGQFRFRKADEPYAPYMYMGIHVMHPRILAGRQISHFPLTRDVWKPLAQQGRVGGLVYAGQWLHVGTLAQWERANACLPGTSDPEAP